MQKNKPFTGYSSKLKDRARELRKNMTRQEKHLWYDFLRNYPVKVYRQRVIERFIADFYCSAAKLVIELDGRQHYAKDIYEYDKARTEAIERYGIEVIRFSNEDIDKNFDAVCKMIDKIIKDRTTH